MVINAQVSVESALIIIFMEVANMLVKDNRFVDIYAKRNAPKIVLVAPKSVKQNVFTLNAR